MRRKPRHRPCVVCQTAFRPSREEHYRKICSRDCATINLALERLGGREYMQEIGEEELAESFAAYRDAMRGPFP